MGTGARKVKFIAEKSVGEFEKTLNKLLSDTKIRVTNIDYKPVTVYEYKYEEGDTEVLFTALVEYVIMPVKPNKEGLINEKDA